MEHFLYQNYFQHLKNKVLEQRLNINEIQLSFSQLLLSIHYSNEIYVCCSKTQQDIAG